MGWVQEEEEMGYSDSKMSLEVYEGQKSQEYAKKEKWKSITYTNRKKCVTNL